MPVAHPTFRLGLIADDLTGASDAAVQFARRGWEAVLVLSAVARSTHPSSGVTRRSLGEGGEVIAVTTDCRALDNATAERLTADAVAHLVEAGIDRIYLKIDSTMRGSVPGQIAGALSVWRKKYPDAAAVVCPAYPRMGRTVVDNRLLVDGRPVEQSAIGRDPVTPVTTSDLAALIPGARHLDGPAEAGPHDVLAKDGHAFLGTQSASIVTVDAGTDDQLAAIASAVAAAGPRIIAVGSAGLADAMAAVWSGPIPAVPGGVRREPDQNRRILIQVTSLNPVSHAQIAKLAQVFPDVVVLTGRAEEVAVDLADRVEREQWNVLGLIGGDGARAALHLLGASAIRIVDALLEGIPRGVIVGGRADGMPIFTKAGGFGAEDALVRVVERLRN